jgi:hypothetical protein
MSKSIPATARRRWCAVLAVVAVTLAAAPSAQAAGDPTAADDQYGAVLGEQSGGQAGGGTLPFTGLDLAALVGAGAGLVATGAGVRRLARER